MGYKSKFDNVTDGGQSWTPGPYKMKIAEAKEHSSGNIQLKIETWTESGGKGPAVYDWLNITSEKDGALREVDRRLQVWLGKTSFESEQELVGKTGYVVLRKGEKYLESMPFGGYYTADRKSATGSESMSDRIKEALEYTAAPSTPAAGPAADEPDMPF